mmetsp:Transcript_24635/g.28152  ORF Transcript_24635/g.28152 Transcript_24635/m.28152 type:complete len:376 (+) Transcript_24635:151-1278(+)
MVLMMMRRRSFIVPLIKSCWILFVLLNVGSQQQQQQQQQQQGIHSGIGIGIRFQPVSAWSWSLSDTASKGPKVHGHTCITTPIRTSPTGTEPSLDGDDLPTNDRIFLFGGQLPHGVQPTTSQPMMTTVAKPSTTISNKAFQMPPPPGSKATKTKQDILPSSPSLNPPATTDLWVYEKDKINNADDWELMPRKIQGVSRPSKRMYTASAVLGHTLYLFGGMDPQTGKALSDVYALSLKTNKWCLVQCWMPYLCSGHAACQISDTSIAIHTGKVDNELLVFVSDGRDWSVVRQPTTGEGPNQLQNCACVSLSSSSICQRRQCQRQRRLILIMMLKTIMITTMTATTTVISPKMRTAKRLWIHGPNPRPLPPITSMIC